MRCFLTTAPLFALAATVLMTGCMASPSDEADDETVGQAEEAISGKSGSPSCGHASDKSSSLDKGSSVGDLPSDVMPPIVQQPTLAGGCAGAWSEMPSHEAPSHEAPSFAAPNYPAPNFGAPSYTPPVYQAPVYQSPNYQAPSRIPVFSAPTYTAPSYAGPTYSAPIYQAPTYSAPSFPAPIYMAPTYLPANPMLPANAPCVGFGQVQGGYGSQGGLQGGYGSQINPSQGSL